MKTSLMMFVACVSLALFVQAEEAAAKITFDGTPGTDSSGLTADRIVFVPVD